MIYKPEKSVRFFNATTKYDQIDWSKLDSIVDAFSQRIHDWYIEPAKALESASGHHAFAIMAINRLLIDSLSQYWKGDLSSDGNTFKDFIRSELAGKYATNLATKIQHDDHKAKRTLSDVADVLWHGFRCGILHQAHIPLYGTITPGGNAVEEKASGFSYYADGTDCPTVNVVPAALLDAITTYFNAYIGKLKNRSPAYDNLRKCFQKKASDSFGIDITTAS
jgi:hypothetical protein